MADLTLQNKSARILHISLGGGAVVTVPPVEGGGGIAVTMTDTEKAAFDRNVATAVVQAWITAGDLVITEAPPPEPLPDPPLVRAGAERQPDAPDAPDAGRDQPDAGRGGGGKHHHRRES